MTLLEEQKRDSNHVILYEILCPGRRTLRARGEASFGDDHKKPPWFMNQGSAGGMRGFKKA
jgi:hypothetical protein